MEKLNQKKIAIATGSTSLVFYFGCVFTMLIFGKEALVKLANLLFHGVDFTNIVRMDVPILETIIGAGLSFIIWGLAGYIFALIYNRIK